MSATIGQKVKFFRTHRKLSQFDLELVIGASNGSISRIENDQTNPTKETLLGICNVLELNEKEKDYMIGIISEPATEYEIEKARSEVAELMKTPGVLAYVMDDRGRLIDVSDTFITLLGIKSSKNDLIKQSLLLLILDEKLGIFHSLSKEHIEETLNHYLSRFYLDTYFFIDDEIIDRQRKFVQSNPLLAPIWKKVAFSDPIPFQSILDREVVFELNKVKIPLVYSTELLLKYRRFELIQYSPSNELNELIRRT